MLMLLLARIVFCIDTRTRIFYLRIGRFFRFDLDWQELVPQPVIRICWWSWRPGFAGRRAKKPRANKPKKARRTTPARQWRRVTGILGSFDLQRLELDLDTGDTVLNAQLYPLNHIIRNDRMLVNVNWQHKNRLLLVLESRGIHLLYHLVK